MLRLLGASVLAVVLWVSPNLVGPCMGLEKPVEGPLLAGFAPTGRFSGHWGVDWAVPKGTEIRSAGPGTVTFAGSVAGNQAVTLDHLPADHPRWRGCGGADPWPGIKP